MEFSPSGTQGFLGLILSGVATMANHPQKELAKFGYRSNTYCLYMGISDLFIFPHVATYADF